jgi:hypothetical protein
MSASARRPATTSAKSATAARIRFSMAPCARYPPALCL